MEHLFSIYIRYYSMLYGVEPQLVNSIIKTESEYKINTTGKIGEIGLMQIRYEYWKGPLNLYDPETNIAEGIRRLASLKRLKPRLGQYWYVAYNLGATGAIKYAKRRDIAKFRYVIKVEKNSTLIFKPIEKSVVLSYCYHCK